MYSPVRISIWDDASGRGDSRKVARLPGYRMVVGLGFLRDGPQKAFMDELECMPTLRSMRADRTHVLTTEDTRNCECKLGQLRRLATVSRSVTCARLARLAAEVNALQERDIYRFNDHI